MTVLEGLIRRRIEENGPMDVAAFMELVVAHYYSTRDPFGAAGDFTTAPEISQMFGEVLGAWAADQWMKLGSPSPFILMEAGPGRGTLMADALRATAKVPGFHKALCLILLETSPVLKEKQKAALAAYDPLWIDDLSTIATFNGPIIFLANEFLDALPVRQMVFEESEWRERVVVFEDGKLSLSFRRKPESIAPSSGWTPAFAGVTGEVCEHSPACETFIRDVAKLLKTRGGAALFIDYGYEGPTTGDTLQAVKGHKFVSVLEHIGEADLTAHVDFGTLKKIVGEEGLISSLEGQGAFLKGLGIEQRAQALSARATPEQKRDIAVALARLTGPEQMGRLFRVLTLV